MHPAADLGHHSLAFGLLAGFEQLFHAGETAGDVRLAGHAAGVEGAQGQLRARLTDGLGGDDAHRRAHFDHVAAAQVHAVALGAHAVGQFAGQRRTHLDALDLGRHDAAHMPALDHLALLDDDLARLRIHHPLGGHPAPDALPHALAAHIVVSPNLQIILGAAVLGDDDHILHYIHQTAGEVSGVGGAQRRVGQALARTVGGDEVLQGAQPLAEVGADGQGDDTARGVGHHPAHARQLGDGSVATLGGARNSHHGQVIHRIQVLLDGFAHLLGGPLPDLNDALVLLLLGEQAAAEGPLNLLDLGVGLLQNLFLLRRHFNIAHGHGDARHRSVMKAQVFDLVGHLHRGLLTAQFVD